MMNSLTSGVINVLVYFIIGISLCGVGYKGFGAVLYKDLDKEIDNHNVALGIAIGGLFIAIAIIVSGVI